MLIRNLNASKGLVSGTRMIVKQPFQNSIDAGVVTGEARRSRVLVPSIVLSTADPTMPFIIKRKQFPVKLAFTMTINKSQNQTVRRLGIYLPQPVFFRTKWICERRFPPPIYAIAVSKQPTLWYPGDLMIR